MKINEKLLNIQSELKAPKNQRNNFGGYNYRNCEDILEAVKPLLKKNKVTLTITDEMVMIGDRYYIKATATLMDEDQQVSVSAYAREEETKKGMDASQITGSTSSYARKYSLNGLFCIDDTKDADYPGQEKIPERPVLKEKPRGELQKCVECGAAVPENVATFSNVKYKKILCMNCQKKVK